MIQGAGKRQVKPSQDIALLEDQLAAESSDDSEYKIGSDNDSNSNDESNENDISSSDEDEEDEQSDDEISPKNELESLQKDDHENLTTKELIALGRKELDHNNLPKWVENVKICGCCLGQSSTESNEIVDCDGCGIRDHTQIT